MMSPPLAIETPSAIDFLAPVAHLDLRRIDVAALDLGDVAQREAGCPLLPRIGIAAQLLDRVELRRSTRTCTRRCRRLDSAGGLDRVLLRRAAASTWLKSRPSCARRFCEISMKIFSSCTPNSSTLATSCTRSSCWRTSSAKCLELGVAEAVAGPARRSTP